MRAQKLANGQKCKGEGSRERTGAGSEPNQPAHMEDRGSEETLSDINTLGASSRSASARCVSVLSGPSKPRGPSPRYIYTELHTNSAPCTFYLRLRAFSITRGYFTMAWTAHVLFTIHHSSTAGGGTNPGAEGVEEVYSFGRPTAYVHSVSEEFN